MEWRSLQEFAGRERVGTAVEGGLAGIGTVVEGGLERVGTAAEGWLCGLSSSRTLQAPSWFTVLEVGAARLHTHAYAYAQ